ncbi:MAG: hypothetical protein ACFB00_06270 [Parvularculaceae bacterium]
MSALKSILFAGFAACLAACGGSDDPSTKEISRVASLDVASPIDEPFVLKDAAPIDVDRLIEALPKGARPTFAAAAFDEALGATVLTDVVVKPVAAALDAPGIDVNVDVAGVAIDRVEIYGADVDALRRLFAADASDETLLSAFRKLRLYGVRGLPPEGAEAADGAATIEAVEIDRLRARPGAFAPGAAAAGPFDAYAFDGVFLKGVALEDPSASPEEGAASFRAPDVRFVGGGGKRLNAIVAKAVEAGVAGPDPGGAGVQAALLGAVFPGFEPPASQRTLIEEFAWRDLDFRDPDAVDLGAVALTNMQTFLDGRLFAQAPRVDVSEMAFADGAPATIRASAKDVIYDFTAYLPETADKARAALVERGLDAAVGESEISYDWRTRDGAGELRSRFRSETLAAVDLAADFAARPDDSSPTDGPTALSAFDLVIEDNALLDAFFEIAALDGRGARMRRTTPTLLRFAGLAAGGVSPRLPDYADAVADFIEDGGALVVHAAPAEPAAFDAIEAAGETPEALPDVLNLTIERRDASEMN